MRIIALLLALAMSVIHSANAASIFWVSFHEADDDPSDAARAAGFTRAPDAGYTDVLAANGHIVTRILTSGTPNTSLLNTADLVIISRSVPSDHYDADAETRAWNGITAPTLILGGYLLRNSRLGYTTGGTMVDVNSSSVRLTIDQPTHPIFAGVSLDDTNTMVDPYASRVTFNNTQQLGISVNTNPLAGGGTLLARVGTAGDAAVNGMVIGEWQEGSTMATSPADTLGGHRLVFLTGSREQSPLTSQGAGIYDLNPAGERMFLNAVNYMAVPEPGSAGLLALAGAMLLGRRRRP